MKEFNTLTRAEMQIMNILWDKGCGMTTHEIIDVYPEPRPAYSTIATFLKILTHKKYVTSYKPKSVIRISLCRTAKRNPLIFPI